MISLEEIKNYLPRYLSTESQDLLFEDLKNFPDNIGGNFYSRQLTHEPTIYQGDGVDSLLFVNLPNPDTGSKPALILSNSCDIHPENTRFFATNVCYAPIFQLNRYRSALLKEHVETGDRSIDAIDAHISAIRKQFNTTIFYLPEGGGLETESIVFLDRINNCPAAELFPEGGGVSKIFTLSNYGFYVFLIKLSIHFTRIQESVDRIVE